LLLSISPRFCQVEFRVSGTGRPRDGLTVRSPLQQCTPSKLLVGSHARDNVRQSHFRQYPPCCPRVYANAFQDTAQHLSAQSGISSLPRYTTQGNMGVVNTQTDKCQLTTESNFNRSSGLDRQRTDVTKQVEALLGDGERHINCFRPRSTTNSSNHLSRFN
jgi:hypothetical protein